MHEFSSPTQLIGRRGYWLPQVDSTNTLAASHANDPDNDGLVFIADEQTAGRGRQGRAWLSPPRSGVLLSVLLFPPEHLRQPVFLTALAAVSVCETIDHCAGLGATLKWPNDVLIRGRKVCGILVERGVGTVIGIGLNVLTPPEVFAAAELPQAGSLRRFTDATLDRRLIAQTLIHLLDAGYQELLAGRTADLEARWRLFLGLIDRQVVLTTPQGSHRGRVVDLGFSGVSLQNGNGQLRRFAPEEIQLLRAAT